MADNYPTPKKRKRTSEVTTMANTSTTDINVPGRPPVRRKKGGKKAKRGAVRTQVLSVIKSMSENKFKALSAENLQLFHNTGLSTGPVVYGNLLRTDSGSNQNQRVGDSVWGEYLQMRLWLSNKSDRTNVMYRILIVATPPDQVNNLNPTGFWKGICGNKIIDYVNSDIYRVVYEHIIDVEAGDTSQEPSANLREISSYHKFNIPLNRKITYQTDTSGTVVEKDQRDCLVMCIIPYDAFGTLVTDNIASYAASGIFVYKDL